MKANAIVIMHDEWNIGRSYAKCVRYCRRESKTGVDFISIPYVSVQD